MYSLRSKIDDSTLYGGSKFLVCEWTMMGREEACAKEEEQQGEGEMQHGKEGMDWLAPHHGYDKRWRRGAGVGCRRR